MAMADDNPHLTDLNLPANLLRGLQSNGFKRLDDVRHLSTGDLLRLPAVGGYGFGRLLKALGRDRLPGKTQ